MGQNNVQTLQRAIMEIAQQEVQGILDEAKTKAASIKRQAEREAQGESAHVLEEARQTAQTLVDQAAAKAQLEARMLQLDRRERLLARTFDAVRQRLPALVQQPDYAGTVKHLIGEAVAYLGEPAYIIEMDAATRAIADDAFLQALGAELGVNLEYAAEESASPEHKTFEGIGVVLTTADGHQRYDNTLEARLTRMQDRLRTAVYHILMEDAS